MSKTKNRIVIEVVGPQLYSVYADRDPGEIWIIDHNKIAQGELHIDHYVPDCRSIRVDQSIQNGLKAVRRAKQLQKKVVTP